MRKRILTIVLYLAETNGEYFASPLAKQWNSSAFMKVGTPENAHKFQDKAAAQKMANLQNMMNEAFGSTSRVYVVEGATTNTLYNDKGNAIDSINNYFGNYATIYRNTPDFIPQLGDLAVWTTGSYSVYGHISIVYSANMQSFVSLDQNWNAIGSMGNPAHFVTHSYDNVTHFIRPNFTSSIDDGNNNTSDKDISYSELYGRFTENTTLKVRRLSPSTSALATNESNYLNSGDTVYFDRIYSNEGYWWIRFQINGANVYAYVGDKTNGATFNQDLKNGKIYGSIPYIDDGSKPSGEAEIPDRIPRQNTYIFKGNVSSYKNVQVIRYGSLQEGFKFVPTANTFYVTQPLNIYEVHNGFCRVHPSDNLWISKYSLKNVEFK
ncbi:CHAP domain-containing protein [Staphylococcus felis]|uniref:CHAP domain-containing protein n=1 Tax=Staphylococcus felis TaxID=46127 RepID=UPI00115979DD|nr:CHAP domain-containing protein [Staphylococcus felis]